MKPLRTSFLTALGLALLAGIASLAYQKGVDAQVGSTPVRVVNTATAPALARDVDRRVPYQVSRLASTDSSTNLVSVTLPPVPAGKRLVIDFLSVAFEVSSGKQVSCFVQAEDAIAGSAEFQFQLSLQSRLPSLVDDYVGSQRALIFVGAGKALTVICLGSSTGGFDNQMRMTAAGYLVDE
jgi:hypothetical protein